MNMSPQEPIRILNKDDKPAHRVKYLSDDGIYILDGYITMSKNTYDFLYLEGIDVPVFVGRNANCAC